MRALIVLELGQIERIDERIEHANWIVLADPVIQAFGKKRALPAILPRNEALHPIPRKSRETHITQGVFTQPGSMAAVAICPLLNPVTLRQRISARIAWSKARRTEGALNGWRRAVNCVNAIHRAPAISRDVLHGSIDETRTGGIRVLPSARYASCGFESAGLQPSGSGLAC